MAFVMIALFARTGQAQAAPAPSGLTPQEAFALMLADPSGECSAEASDNPLELCGVELFGDFVDEQFLLMPRDTCSVLLEELFKDQVCAPGDVECQQAAHGALPAPGPKVVNGGTSSAPTVDPDEVDLMAAIMGRWRRAASEPVPESRAVTPPVPPPELRA